MKTEDINESYDLCLPFKRLSPNAIIPHRAHERDSGLDIHALESVVIDGFDFKKVSTGIACEIPRGYELQIRPRSGLAAKKGVVAAFGTVDMDYRGEIGVTIFNHNDEPIEICAGDRIAQIVPARVLLAKPVEFTEELSKTDRGEGGFGSTGM